MKIVELWDTRGLTREDIVAVSAAVQRLLEGDA